MKRPTTHDSNRFQRSASMAAGLTVLLAPLGHGAPLPGLLHHWNFDEGPDWHDSAFQSTYNGTTAYNYGSSSSNATLQNMDATNWVSGRQFTALQFNGSDEFLNGGTDLAAGLGGTTSLSLWLRTTATGTATPTTSPGITGSATSGGVQPGWIDDTGRVAFSVGNTLVARSAAPVNDDRWHHVVLSRDATSGLVQVYVDGALSASATGATGVKSSAFTSLARLEGSSAGYFQGRLDQVHVFNRVISAAEVTTLQTNHAPKTWNDSYNGVNSRTFTTPSVFSKCYDVEGDTVSVSSWTQPAHGTIVHNGDGSFNYTANAGYLGKDSFEIVVEDGQGGYHRSKMDLDIISEPTGGSAPLLRYTGFTALQANGADIALSGWRVPRVMDWDGDGKLDLLVGNGGSVWRYMNTGTAQAPSYAAGVQVQANGSNISVGSNNGIAYIDMTGDGVRDLVVSDSANKLRIYRNTAAANQPPVFAANTFVKNTSNADLVLPDRRFDLGDWNGDGKVDLVTGTGSSSLQLFLNSGTASAPQFPTAGQVLFSDAYNLYPRLQDADGNGYCDFTWGINWGTVTYWRDTAIKPQSSATALSITLAGGGAIDMHGQTDGAIVDYADLNGDGALDLVIGGHSGTTKIFVAYGAPKTVAQSIAAIEAIYDAHPADLGTALSANNNELLNQLNAENQNLITYIQMGTLGAREAVYNALVAHIAKYPFLKYQALDTAVYHHVPSIVAQNWVMLGYALADTPARRVATADAMGLTGTLRTLYLEQRLAVGDNVVNTVGHATIRDFRRRHPRELFPDAIVTVDQFAGDQRGGFIWTPNSTKNVFGYGSLGSANEFAGDLTTAINKIMGAGAANGDYFTLVLGHETSHSLDAYVNGRANADLRRRWGLSLCTAGGTDVIAGANGWRDVAATKANFLAKGYWDGVEANWNAAWDAYWATGPGAPFDDLGFMRGNIGWFFNNSQESLATQGNNQWQNAPGRLIGAVDRFRRATETGIAPMKANINEVVTFIDFQSAGMNRVNLIETKYQASPQQVNWFNHYADLERNDKGYITRVTVDGHRYDFAYNVDGVVTDVDCSIGVLTADTVVAPPGAATTVDVLANDYRLDGKAIEVTSFGQPLHGTVSAGAGGTLVYQPVAGYSGADSFTYTTGSTSSTVAVSVPSANSDDDSDGLTFAQEQTYGTNPGVADTDGDGFRDGFEVAMGTDPTSSASQLPAIYGGLRAWWKLDENSGTVADDATARPQDGTLLNGATWTTGIVDKAVTLNGTNQSIQIPSLGLSSNTVTLSAWVKRNGSQPGWAGIVFDRGNGASGLGFGTANDLRYHWNDAGNSYGFASGLTVPDNTWTFCALVIEPTKATFYMKPVGGALQSAVNNVAHSAHNFSATAYLGQDSAGGRFFKGSLDDVHVYSRALNAAEISELYDTAIPQPPAFTSDPIAMPAATEDAAYTGQTLAGSATDPDWGDTLTYSKVSGPAWLSVASNGALSGTPGNGNVGVNSFTVRVTDGSATSDDAVLNITLTNVNDAPAFTVDPIAGSAGTEGSAYSGSIAGTASDIDAGDTLTYSKVSGPSWLSVAANGALGGAPGVGTSGNNSFTVRVTDAVGASDDATLTIVIAKPPGGDDTDGDGFTNAFEETVGTDPYDNGSTPPPAYAGMKAWWRLNDASGTTAVDSSGSGLNSTLLNSPVWTTGLVDGALAFNGTNQSAQVPALGLSSNTVTLSAWVKRNGTQPAWAGLIFDRGNNASGLGFGSSHELRYHWNNTSGSYNFNSGLTVPDNTWTFCAVVIEPTKATLYMQPLGGLMQTAVKTLAHSAHTFSASTYLGQDSQGGRFFKGTLDEVRIHSRALSAAEIGQLYAEDTPAGSAGNPLADDNGNGILDLWETSYFGNASIGANGADEDPDHDGMVNLLEYALGTHPLEPSVSPVIQDTVDGQYLRLTVQKNSAATNLIYTVQSGALLNDWSTQDTTVESETANELIVRDNVTGASKRFIRLHVEAAP